MLSVDYVQPHIHLSERNATGNASIDIGMDGSVEWSAGSRSNWHINLQTSIPINVAVSASLSVVGLFGGGYGNRELTLRFTPNVTVVGSGSPTAAGIPVIDTSGGAPGIGNTSFAISGSNFIASSFVALILTAGPTIPAPGIAVPDAQPGCNLHVGLPHDICAVMTADAAGKAAFPLGIPADPYLVGLQVGTQWLAADLSLPYPLAIGSSPALAIRISN
jgi:hypothetical protein